jgi:hypothetical protein
VRITTIRVPMPINRRWVGLDAPFSEGSIFFSLDALIHV